MNNKKFYIATAIAYASKPPHVGNDYDLVLADCIARFKKMCGYDVFFSTGTDEHGQKVEGLAKEAGISPKEYADKITAGIVENYRLLGVDYDKFIRTTDKSHEDAVSKIFVKLYESGDIYKGAYEGLYCVPCESFVTQSQANENDGKCPDCGRELKETKEEAYFLKLSKYQERLEKFMEEHPDFIKPEQRSKEILNNFIKPGLQDLCVSRSSIKWGVPVEFDSEHVIYVWIDALSNYITLLGYNPENNNNQPDLFNKNWPCDLHVIGKDITRFHAIYWPVILWGLGLEPPKNILAHPWVLFNDGKMSKSTGNIVYTKDIIARFGRDALRYYLLSEVPFDRDGSFTYANFIKIYNADLANTLGNLLSRTLAMTEKYFDGLIPVYNDSNVDSFSDEMREFIIAKVAEFANYMNEYKTSEAIAKINDILRRANKYIDETEPWVLAKDEKNKIRLGNVLYNLLESLRIAGILLLPIMPDSCAKIFEQINISLNSEEEKSYESAFVFGELKSGKKIGKSEILFARLDEEKVLKEIENVNVGDNAPVVPLNKENDNGRTRASAPTDKIQNNEINIEDFMNVELKVAKIIACEKVEKSDKLLKLKVDLGGENNEERQIVSGIAKFYSPEDLIGKKIIVVANLKAVKLRGIESQGMLLAAGEDDVKVIFVDENVNIGARVR